MKSITTVLLSLSFLSARSQELFTYTEPASNMPSKSIALRVNNRYFYHPSGSHKQLQLAPELMVGFSKKLMMHAETFFSDVTGKLSYSGLSLYAKYRAYSVDDVHSHFRLGIYGRASFVNAPIQQQVIDLNGFNTGFEGGTVATLLNKRTAISANLSFIHTLDNGIENKWTFDDRERNAINTSLSFGRLMLPVEYKNYNQTNVNLMLEVLSQINAGNGRSFVDAAPVVQLIMKSRIRMDFSYRFPILQSADRMMSNGCLIRLDYNFFNVW
jgi:hypothetical protein